jgi:hypothetical protein
MNIKRKTWLLVPGIVIFAGIGLQGCSASKSKTSSTAKSDTTRSIAAYFTPATTKSKTPDAQGFIQRWSLLEPINKPNRSNTVFTDSYIRKAFDTYIFQTSLRFFPKTAKK